MARTIADRERDYKAVDMSRRGFTYRQIAAELGWASPQSVTLAIRRALKEMNNIDGDELVKLMRDRLDDYRRTAWRVLARTHYVTTPSGAIARHPETQQPLVDDSPILQALERLLKYDIEERKMLGLDAPIKHRIDVITEDAVDAECRKLEQEIAERERADSGAA